MDEPILAIDKDESIDHRLDSILSTKYPAKNHCLRVATYLAMYSSTPTNNGLLYLESARTRMNEDNDQESPFRQRRYFYYLTGCELPDCAMIYDIGKHAITLFIPPVDPDEVVWSGMPLLPKDALEKYDIDDARTTDEIHSYLNGPETLKNAIFAIDTQVSDDSTFAAFNAKNLTDLKPAIEERRVVKDDHEIALIRRANQISERAHTAVMRAARTAETEQQLEALFLQQCVANGCRNQAYSPIFASGTDAATLHYIKNDKPIGPSTRNLLLDAGAELRCYASDITRTWPVNGRFTPESRAIYALVLKMQKACLGVLKPDVQWDGVHTLAHRVAIEGLLDLGILRGGSVDEILAAKTSAAFFPHGLGHFLGMDTHDCGGRPDYKDPDPLFRYLRVRRKLPLGAVITVEPGLYFCRFMIEPYLAKPEHARFIDEKVLDRYWDVGGVRIEDNVLITTDGIRNLTSVPKEIDELEALIGGSAEPFSVPLRPLPVS